MTAKHQLSICSLFFTLIIYAQNFTIQGKVTDASDTPLEYATVSVQNPDSLEELYGGVTDKNGNFSIEVQAGNYLLYIESFTGNTYEQPIQIAKNENLGVFKLGQSSVVALEGANIVGSNQTYRMELDKKIYDVSKDPLSKGASVSDALQNVPSVQVDSEGAVSLRGNENVKILIDGKPSYLLGISDPAQALESLPADAVERIEVVTNPSSRYEAEGSAGIINIILKKGKLNGLNGSVSVNGSIPKAAGASVNLNYRTGKWNLFTNLGYQYRERERESSSNTTRFNSDGIPRYEDSNQNSVRVNNGYNLMLGTEYYLDDKNTFSLSGSYRNGDNKNNSDILYHDYDSGFNLTNTSIRTEDEVEDDYSAEINFGFKHEFDEPSHVFTVDAQASYQKENETGNLLEFGDLINSTERSFSNEKERNVLISADYVYPFGEKSRLEIGARGEQKGTFTEFSLDSLSAEGWIPKTDFSNKTDYLQNVFAGYVQYGTAFGKFSFLAGMRLENSDITVKSILNQGVTHKNYVDFFPSLYLNYEFNEDDQLQLSYSKRIRRPRGWDLIPFTSYSNNRNLFMGNPDLDPQYTDSYELSYITKIGSLMITPNVYYSYTKDNIQRFQSVSQTGVLVTRPINIGSEQRYGGDLTFTYRPVKWWNIMGNINLFGYQTDGLYTETYLNSDSGEELSKTTDFSGEGFSWFGRLNNSFTLPENFSAQLSGMYRGGQKTAQSERKPMYGLDFSLSKDFLNDNATLTLNLRDVLNSRGFDYSSFGDDFRIDGENRWSKRTISLTFTYRFNQSKRDQKRQERQQDEGSDEGIGEGEIPS